MCSKGNIYHFGQKYALKQKPFGPYEDYVSDAKFHNKIVNIAETLPKISPITQISTGIDLTYVLNGE